MDKTHTATHDTREAANEVNYQWNGCLELHAAVDSFPAVVCERITNPPLFSLFPPLPTSKADWFFAQVIKIRIGSTIVT